MTLRFWQTFTVFPGVQINIGKRGISTSIGVPGAEVEFFGWMNEEIMMKNKHLTEAQIMGALRQLEGG